MIALRLLSAAAVLASTVLADGAAIISAIEGISADTVGLNDTVASWDGGPLGVVPIGAKTGELLLAIGSGTLTARASAPLSDIEAFTLAVSTQALAADVKSALTTIVAAKPKFDRLLVVSPVTLLNLALQRKASQDFSAALIDKVPAALQDAARSLAAPIDAAFAAAIDEYNPF